MTRAIMFMGTGSDVGKSLVVAGLARAYANRGLRVAPFKPQNMSNNAAVTADGGEIGRAQALQARGARREPVTAMNPATSSSSVTATCTPPLSMALANHSGECRTEMNPSAWSAGSRLPM